MVFLHEKQKYDGLKGNTFTLWLSFYTAADITRELYHWSAATVMVCWGLLRVKGQSSLKTNTEDLGLYLCWVFDQKRKGSAKSLCHSGLSLTSKPVTPAAWKQYLSSVKSKGVNITSENSDKINQFHNHFLYADFMGKIWFWQMKLLGHGKLKSMLTVTVDREPHENVGNVWIYSIFL